MFERYTEKARRVIFFARYEASQLRSSEITTEHILLALFREDSGFLKASVPGLTAERARDEMEKHTSRGEYIPTSVDMPLSQATKRALAYSAEESGWLGHKHIGSEHLLLGLARENNCLAAKLLREHGFEPAKARKEIGRTASLQPTEPRWGRLISHAEAEGWAVLYQWDKRRCEPRDALRNLVNQRLSLYRGEPFDAAQFNVVKGGWTHYRCVICWRDLYAPNDAGQRVGYTNGQEWLCASRYKRFAAPVSEADDDED